MKIILILILLTLWLIACVVCGAVGFFVGIKYKPKTELKTAPEPTEKELRAAKRAQYELDSMLSFDGDPQKEFTE